MPIGFTAFFDAPNVCKTFAAHPVAVVQPRIDREYGLPFLFSQLPQAGFNLAKTARLVAAFSAYC
jgi:hypothetical protein